LGKIFEALDKTGLAGDILQDLKENTYAAAVDDMVAVKAAPAPAPAPVKLAITHEKPAEVPDAQYRIVSLRVASTSPILPFEEDSHASEQYRLLRTRIVQHPGDPRTIVVSSAAPRDGKSVTALNLAGALSLKGDSRVLLIDGDFRRPSIWRLLGVEQTPGIGDVLEGTAELHEAIVQAREYPNLFILPAGAPKSNPGELLDSDAFKAAIGSLKSLFSYLIIDSPPIAAVADCDLLMAISDGVIVVIRPDHTSRQACKKALESVPKEKSLGVVMNCVPDWFLGKSHGYGAYY
jgi:protein-tyrosine kinase